MRITKLHLIIFLLLIAVLGIYWGKEYHRRLEERRKAALELERIKLEEQLRQEFEEKKKSLEEERLRMKTLLAQEAIAVAGEYWKIAHKEGKDITKGQATLRLAKETLSNENDPDKAWELAQQAIKELKESAFADKTYRIKSGDTLWGIAAMKKHFSDGKKWKYIYLANKQKIKNPRRIYPRQSIVVPVASWQNYQSDISRVK